MESTRRSVAGTGLALALVGAIAVAPITAPSAQRAAPLTAIRPGISTATVQLTDQWSNLFSGLSSVSGELWAIANGKSGTALPVPSNPFAPIAEQVVINIATYAGQLVSGHGGAIPGEVVSHLGKTGQLLWVDGGVILTAAIQHLVPTITAAVTTTLAYIRQNNPLNALVEAPAVALSYLLQYPLALIADSLYVRNAIATALDPPLPSWLSWLNPAKKAIASTKPVTTVAAAKPLAPAASTTPVKPTTGHPAHDATVTAVGSSSPTSGHASSGRKGSHHR
ncbi:MAG: hypothetical protein WCE30_09695 [Mycobacterium sp.]